MRRVAQGVVLTPSFLPPFTGPSSRAAADRVGKVAEDSAEAVAGVVADAIRIGGEVTAKSIGVTVHTVSTLASKGVRPTSDDGAAEPAAPRPAAKKKAAVGKTGSTKRKTTASKKKTAAKKAA